MKSRDLSSQEFIDLAQERAQQSYDERESEYPVLAGMYALCFAQSGRATAGLQREELVEWANRRFSADLSLDDLKSKQREEIRSMLVEYSRKMNVAANKVATEAQQRVEALFAESGMLLPSAGNWQ